DLPQRLVRVDALAGLVDVGDLHRLADLELTAVERLQPDDRLEERGLADAVRADDTDDAVGRQREGQPVDELAVPEALLQVLRLDDHRAQARARRDLDLLEVELAHALGLGGHLLVALETGLGLGLAAAGAGAHPLQLLLEALLARRGLLALDRETGGLLLPAGGVAGGAGVEPAAAYFGDRSGAAPEEVAVVGAGAAGAGVLGQVLREPEQRLAVQVVGGLVEQEQVGLLEEELAQRHAATLTTG